MVGIRYTSDIINVQPPILFGEREREREREERERERERERDCLWQEVILDVIRPETVYLVPWDLNIDKILSAKDALVQQLCNYIYIYVRQIGQHKDSMIKQYDQITCVCLNTDAFGMSYPT